MQQVKYPHLRLIDWPFRDEPDPLLYPLMADREQLQRDVDTLLQNLSRRTPSTIHLMWAYFGAGKTHTLRHLEYLSRERYNCFMPIYTDLPRVTKGFFDLYRLTISHVDLEGVKTAFEEIYTHKDGGSFLKKLQFDFPDLSLTLKKLLGAPESEQDTCIRWLRGENLERRTLKTVGISKAISFTEEAVNVLAWFIQILNQAAALSGGKGVRVIWMLDEYQRIKDCRPGVRTEINNALHAVFNRSPSFLSIIISFSGHPQEKKWPEWLSPEIRDRIGVVSNALLLPPLGRDEAVKFVRDVLRFFRPPESDQIDPFFPFTEGSANEVLKLMSQKHVEIKPRSIMQFFTVVLEKADRKIESGEITKITDQFVADVLKYQDYRESEKE